MYTREQLQELQDMPLDRKIQRSISKILEWHQQLDGQVFVSFSGGKDSTVLAHLVRSILPEVELVFAHTGVQYPEVVDFVRTYDNVTFLKPVKPFAKVLKEYGYPVISKDVAKVIGAAQQGKDYALASIDGLNNDGTYSYFRQRYKKHKHLVGAPFKISEKCCYYLKKEPFRRYITKEKKYPYIGTMACESHMRKDAWLKLGCNAFNADNPRSTPISFWTEQDILAYIKLHKLPIASVYGKVCGNSKYYYTTGVNRTGCVPCMFGAHLERGQNRFQKLAVTHPKLYDGWVMRAGISKVLDFIGVPYTPEGERMNTEQNIQEYLAVLRARRGQSKAEMLALMEWSEYHHRNMSKLSAKEMDKLVGYYGATIEKLKDALLMTHHFLDIEVKGRGLEERREIHDFLERYKKKP